MSLQPEDVRDVLARWFPSTWTRCMRAARFSLTVRRGPGGWVASQQVLPRAAAEVPAGGSPDEGRPPAESEATGQPAVRPAPTPAGPGELLHEVRAPLVGTFYRAPQPGAEPFVQVGSRVEETTVVGIVETMKLMNPVLAGVAGTVVEI